VAGPAVLSFLNERDRVVRALAEGFKAQPAEIVDRVTALQGELKASHKALALARSELALARAEALLPQAEQVAQGKEGEPAVRVLVARLDGLEPPALQTAAQRLQERLGEGAAVLLGGAPVADRVSLVAAFGAAVVRRGLKAGSLVRGVARACGGGGGGRPNLAQAGGRDVGALDGALSEARETLHDQLSRTADG